MASALIGEMYCVLTSQETPISGGRFFRFKPYFFIGVTGSSAHNNSSSSRSTSFSPFGARASDGGCIRKLDYVTIKEMEEQFLFCFTKKIKKLRLSVRIIVLVYTEIK